MDISGFEKHVRRAAKEKLSAIPAEVFRARMGE
jgi:hypothetical protein